VGNTVQKVLQGRGDKKRQGSWIGTALPVVLLFATYLGLLLEFPVKKQSLWFLFAVAAVFVCTFAHKLQKGGKQTLEFLFSLGLLVAGSAQALALPWLRLVYFPFMISLTALYDQKTILSLLLLLPFLELPAFFKGLLTSADLIFFASLAATIGISLLLKNNMQKKPHGRPLPEDQSSYESSGTRYQGIGDERDIADVLEEISRTDDEIKDLLVVTKNTVFADSVNLFINSAGSIRLRCSTDETAGIIPAEGGLLTLCFKEKKPYLASEIGEKKIDVGYLKREGISSLAMVPITDDNMAIGVLAADSMRYHAFSGADLEIMQKFSSQIAKILQRERVYPQIQRSYDTLKILNEESSKLIASLDADVIVKNLIDGVFRIAPSETIFFAVKGREAEILHTKSLPSQEKRTFNTKGTLLDIASKNDEPLYISDLRNYRSPVLPFKTENINSVLLLPLFYERTLLGILTLLFEKVNSLSPHHIEIMRVLGNQASTSIANARFHAEIERLAVTDGLTGLFNHRHFQERLTQEFNRMGRSAGPFSLLLIDIDHFKKVNDTYGHPVGDAVLKKVSGTISKIIRNIDVAARYGGEEFAVILVGTDAGGATKMAERLRRTVTDMKISAERNTISVTVSIGIATNTGDIGKKEDIIERADRALYYSKKNGRNQSTLWKETEHHD